MAQLWIASERGDARAVAALLDGDCTSVAVNHAGKWGTTPLFVASERGHVEVVSTLLAKQEVNVNQAANNGCTPLYIASWNGHSEVVSMLLAKQGVDVNQVLPVVVVKDPFTWMRSMCRMDLCGNQVMHRGPGFGSNSDTISERYARPTGPSGTSRNLRHASH